MIKNFLTTNHTNQTNRRKKDFGRRVRIVRDVRGLFLLLYIFTAVSVYTQTGTSLETEIKNIEQAITAKGVSAQERHAGLVRLATLRQLSGDIETAAKNWLDAARAIPGSVDDNALLNCAYCLAAMGEWNRARTALEPLLSKSARARFLNTSIIAVTSNNTGALSALADNAEYASMKSEIYFLLWRLSTGQTAEGWRLRLISEFPQSPEARLANGGSLETGQTVALRQSPFWLFMGGLDSLPLMAMPTPAPSTGQIVSAPTITSVSTARLQTGIYSRESNAQTQVQRLRQLGVTPTIEERQIGENKMWAVTVPSGQEQTLKSANIDYFPLR